MKVPSLLKIEEWPSGSVGSSAALSRRRSRVRVSSGSLCGILAQLGEHLPYKQRVIGSSPIGPIDYGWIPEWPKGADCKSVSYAFDGSNPSPPTKNRLVRKYLPIFNYLKQQRRVQWEKSAPLSDNFLH